MSGGLLIAGDYYLNPKNDAGAPTGLIGPLNTTKMEINQPAPDEKVRVSRRAGTLGQALDTVYIGKPTEITIAVDDQPKAMLEMLFAAVSESINEVGAAISAEPVTLIKDRWVKLPDRNISSTGFSLATAAVPGTPLVLGTDYQIVYDSGMIMALTVGAAAACLADYTSHGVTGIRFNGARRVSVKCQVVMDGINMVDGSQCHLEVDEAILYNSGAIDLAKGDYITTELKGKLITLEGQAEPYRYEQLTLAAV